MTSSKSATFGQSFKSFISDLESTWSFKSESVIILLVGLIFRLSEKIHCLLNFPLFDNIDFFRPGEWNRGKTRDDCSLSVFSLKFTHSLEFGQTEKFLKVVHFLS